MNNKEVFKWNGQKVFKVIFKTVKILSISDTPLHWANLYVGQIRQVAEVHYLNKIFMIDNEDGTGYRKLIMGGTPNFHHLGYNNVNFVSCEVITDDKINKTFNELLFQKQNTDYKKFLRKNTNYPLNID